MVKILMSDLYKLPDGWEWKALGEISKIIGGGTPRRNVKEYWEDGDIVWLSPTDLGKIGEIINISHSKDKITQLGLVKSSAKLLPIGTVLYSSRATIGKIAINTIEVSTNQGFSNFICNDNLDNKYLAFCLNRFTSEITLLSNSTTFKEVSKTNLKEFKIPIPPLPEQQRIVSKLDAIFQKIDKSIELHKKNINKVNIFMDSVLSEVFGELEEKYDIKTVDEVSSNIRYGYTNSAKDKGNAVFIRITDMNKNGKLKNNFMYVDIENNELEKFKLYKGDILFARSGATAGKVALFDLDLVAVFASYIIRIQPNNEMDSSFFFYFCHSPKYWEQLNVIKIGGAQPNVNATNLKLLELPIPPLNIQQKVVSYLDDISEKIQKIKLVQKEKMNNLTALKASILDKAFRGEL